MKYDSLIPDSPKVPLGNYLLKLNDNTIVFGVKDYLKKNLTEKYGSVVQASKDLDMSYFTLSKYVYHSNPPIKFLKKHFSSAELKEIFELMTTCSARNKIIRLPKYLTPKLAYVIGYLQGDGSLESNGRRLNFTDEYLSQINHLNMLFEELFDLCGIIEKRDSKISKKSCYYLVLRSKVLNNFFNKVFHIPLGVKRDLRIPEIMLKDQVILKWYLRGLFDADGTLPMNPETCKQYFIDITMKDKAIIADIRKALKQFGIITYEPYLRKAKSPSSDFISHTWELRIRRKDQIIRFLREIGFHHPNKRKRMQKLLSIEKDL